MIDGKLDDVYWQNCPAAATGHLRELQTGRPPTFGTSFKAGWGGDNLYFAIRCEERPGEKLNIAATRNDDQAIWYGDCVEMELETESHSYYQIAINPCGAVVDLDRGAPRGQWFGWDSQAEVATHIADDHWTVEIRIPVTQDENDPLHQVIGRKPTQSLPWHINVCRQRIRGEDLEASAFSPTGTKAFHEPMKFAYFYAGRSHQFEADPTVTDYLIASRAASNLLKQHKHAEALAAFAALADGKVTDFQKSVAFSQAAAVARKMKDFAQADQLAARIPIDAMKKTAVMQNLMAQRRYTQVIAQFGSEDLARWPFWAAGEGYAVRGRAYSELGEKAKAEADFQAALALTTDGQLRKQIAKGREGTPKR